MSTQDQPSKPGTARVVLVDDHALIRDGLRRALEAHGQFAVVAESSSVAAGRAAIRAHAPDVVVVDIRLADGNGLDLVRELRAADPSVGIVVITMYAGDAQMVEAHKAGASAYATKDAPTSEVLAAVRAAMEKPDGFFAAGWADVQTRKSMGAPSLTAREQEVLECLVAGLPVSAIARRLFISESTAKTHVGNIYTKLGAANRAQAVTTALSEGLVLPQ